MAERVYSEREGVKLLKRVSEMQSAGQPSNRQGPTLSELEVVAALREAPESAPSSAVRTDEPATEVTAARRRTRGRA